MLNSASLRSKKARWLLATSIALLLMQFVPYRLEPGKPLDPPQFGSVDELLSTKCGACHGGPVQVAVPLRLAPGSWYATWKVREARSRLNLAEWSNYTPAEQKHLREQMVEEVESGRMPPASYRFFHPSFKISDSEKASLAEWLEPI